MKSAKRAPAPLPPASRVKKPKVTKAEKADDKADEDDAKTEEKDGEPKNEKKKPGRPANAAGNDDAKAKLMNKLLASTAAK